MNYEEDLKAIDESIKRDYEKLVVERYLPIFSEVVRNNAGLLEDKAILQIKLGLPVKKLTLCLGKFVYDGDYLFPLKKEVFPDRTKEEILNGLIRLGRIYQENADYRYDMQTALKMCLSDVCQSVREAVRNKSELANRL